ncbi:MAG: hypothetical protein GY794_16135 [bacterium]|nr:hypothetical protein [bacterium]
MQIELDAKSSEYRELLEGYLNKRTFTVEQNGETLTGCRVTDIQMSFTPGNIIATVTLEQTKPVIVSTPKGRNAYHDLFEQDYSKLEARVLAQLHAGYGGKKSLYQPGLKLSACGDPFDPNAISFYDAGRRCGKSGRLASKEIHKRLNLADRWGVGEERRKQFAIEKLNLHPAQYEFFKAGRGSVVHDFKDGVLHSKHDINLGAHYPHKPMYAAGGPWPRDTTFLQYMAGMGTEWGKSIFGEKSMNRQWKFKSVHPQDIDFDELTQSVTRQDPLALVKGTYTERVKHPTAARNPAGEIIMRNVWDETLDANRADAVQVANAAFPGVIFLKDPVPVMGFTLKPVEREENYVVIHRSLWDKSAVAGLDLPTKFAPKLVNGYGARVYAGVKTAELRKWVAWAKEVKAASWHDEDRRKATFVVDLPNV